MTGFAAHSINLEHASVNFDLRSVNQRYLELHFRLADEVRVLEPQLRELIQQRLTRGKVECRVSLTPISTATPDNGLNPVILERLAHWQAEVQQRLPDSAPLSVNDILRWPGAVPAATQSQATLNEAVLAGVYAMLDEMVESRQREGAKLKQHILDRLAAAEIQVESLRPLLPTLIAAQRDKLTERLHAALGEAGHERLAQEIV
ncbi:MAG: YicC/YloC family endoribonuclease, partial [Thiobacillus sp.]|nr:YicC/YloC family endoribonuclease [Thiobacillus sp.]